MLMSEFVCNLGVCFTFGLFLFFCKDTASTEIYTLSLHDALPIYCVENMRGADGVLQPGNQLRHGQRFSLSSGRRSEEHTSELQSRRELVCRLLLEKKKQTNSILFVDFAKILSVCFPYGLLVVS